MSSRAMSSTSSGSTVIDSEDDQAYIKITELDKLLGIPSPRFDLSTADVDSINLFDSAESSCNFDSDDSTLHQKPGLPQRLQIVSHPNRSETEVCYNKELEQVSVINSELIIGSDRQEMEMECNSYLTEPMKVPPSIDDMLYKENPPALLARGCSSVDSLNCVNKIFARTDDSSPQLQCLQSCDSNNQIPKNPAIIPSPVINKLKKLGTSVLVEHTTSLVHPKINGQISFCETGEHIKSESICSGYLEIMETIDKAVGLTSDLTKKRKRPQKKISEVQVPSNAEPLTEVKSTNTDDDDAKFCFKVNIKQVIDISEHEKLYSCDICSGVYARGFSLKRHYLKTHINLKHISKRDQHNCGIVIDPSIERGGARKKRKMKDDCTLVVTNLSPPDDIPDLYRCHNCDQCFMLIADLRAHLMEHPPVSVRNLAENKFKNYTCSKCGARYQKKKIYLRHQEMCKTEEKVPPALDHLCLYCHLSFSSYQLQKQHQLQRHHPKKKRHQCYLCITKIFKERSKVFKHLISHHSDDYYGCFDCKLRVGTWEALKKHNTEVHKPAVKQTATHNHVSSVEDDHNKGELRGNEQLNNIADHNSSARLKLQCTDCPKMFASQLNMTRHRRLAHKEFVVKKKKVVQKKENTLVKVSNKFKKIQPPKKSLLPTLIQPPPADPEIVFYSSVARNVTENLTHHLDGKLDSQEILEYDLNKSQSEQDKPQVVEIKSFIQLDATIPPDQQQKDGQSTPISPRAVPWEKFCFPKNYDGRCNLTYAKDLSYLDIATQIAVERKMAKQDSTSSQHNHESPANIPAGLLLVQNNKMEPDCAESFGNPNEDKTKDGECKLQLSGEWVCPRMFLCAACGYKSANLWDTEDHKFSLHPNVWVPHVEIIGEDSSAWDWFYHRRLPPGTEVVSTAPLLPVTPPPCSKCQRQCATMAELHRHMLECGGDTTWMATMLAVTSPGTRRRKWRPFGSRRRRQRGRRGLKRNIPNTPAKHSCGRIRTKPGDMDTIQKMIANLPPKRSTRRVIGDDADIKTRSQATINSVRCSSYTFKF